MRTHGRPAVVRRVLPAPPETVFDEWLDSEALAEFMGPAPASATILACDPRVGGELRLVMADGDLVVRISGRYLELDRPRRLRFSWHSDMGGGFDSVVTVTLEPRGEGETLMTIEHAPIPAGLREDHEEGWAQIAEQLAGRIARKR